MAKKLRLYSSYNRSVIIHFFALLGFRFVLLPVLFSCLFVCFVSFRFVLFWVWFGLVSFFVVVVFLFV